MEIHQVTLAFCPTSCAASAPRGWEMRESRNGCLCAQLVVELTHLNDILVKLDHLQLKGVEIGDVRNHHRGYVSTWMCHP